MLRADRAEGVKIRYAYDTATDRRAWKILEAAPRVRLTPEHLDDITDGRYPFATLENNQIGTLIFTDDYGQSFTYTLAGFNAHTKHYVLELVGPEGTATS